MLSPTFSSVLAIVVALASLFLFLISFVAPRLYRAQDLWWSGVGIFYALVLWFCSAQIRGAVLLGTIASVALLGWLSTQVYLSRWTALTDAEKGAGSLKQLQAIGRQFARLLESRPVPSPVTAPMSPDFAAEGTSDPASVKASRAGKSGKVRWVRPEKAKPPEPTEAPADVPIVPPDAPVTEGSGLTPDQSVPAEPLQDQSAPQDVAATTLAEVAEITEQPTDSALETPQPTSQPTEAEAWDDMEADWETEEKSSPIVPAIPSDTTKTNLIQRIKNFFQGRKSHGKRFVRPEDETPAESPKPRSKSSETSERVEPTSEPPQETIADLTLEPSEPQDSINEPVSETKSPEPIAPVEDSINEPVAETESPEPIAPIQDSENEPVSETESPEPIAPVQDSENEPVAETESTEPIAPVQDSENEPVAETESPEPIAPVQDSTNEPVAETESTEPIAPVQESINEPVSETQSPEPIAPIQDSENETVAETESPEPIESPTNTTPKTSP